jgi:hypothetical protein
MFYEIGVLCKKRRILCKSINSYLSVCYVQNVAINVKTLHNLCNPLQNQYKPDLKIVIPYLSPFETSEHERQFGLSKFYNVVQTTDYT